MSATVLVRASGRNTPDAELLKDQTIEPLAFFGTRQQHRKAGGPEAGGVEVLLHGEAGAEQGHRAVGAPTR